MNIINKLIKTLTEEHKLLKTNKYLRRFQKKNPPFCFVIKHTFNIFINGKNFL